MSSLPEAPVLIVGDHRDICQDLQDLLEHDGYLVQSVSTGWEALARVTQQHFHAMILEVGLPDQDGLSLLPLVKAADPLVPIVIVSAHGTGEQKTTALRLGTFAWLDKPYDRNELKALLRRAIGPAAVTIRPEQVEQRLLRVNIEHEALLELIPAMVWYKDAHNRIVRANRRAAESINKTVAEVEGQFTYDLYPEEAEKYYQDDLEVITSGQPKLGIVELYQTASGEKRWIQTDKVPYRDAQGIVMGVLVLAQDITERKEWENTLRDSENRLRAFSGQLEQLVQVRTEELTQSHDRLRGLATELNLAEQRERKRLAAELHDHLQQLLVLGRLKLRQGKELVETLPKGAQLISEADGILAEALTYTRTLVAELSPPVLRDHGLAAGLKWLGAYMHKHDMAVTVTVPKAHLQLPEDQALLLFQSVRELLMNAWKHAATGTAEVTMELDGDRLRLHVHDDGRGFGLAAAETATSTKFASKFGLFSIRERMNALGGAFEIESAPHQGTTATLTLPLGAVLNGTEAEPTPVEASPEGSGTHSARPLPAGEKTRPVGVLLVDDHAMVRQGLRTMLESYADVEVVGEAGDGEEALVCAEQLNPAVVVMDINMPKMNGIEATAHLKARYPDLTIIGLSVNAGEENQQAMKTAGATSLITKEAAVDQLYAAIQETASRGASTLTPHDAETAAAERTTD